MSLHPQRFENVFVIGFEHQPDRLEKFSQTINSLQWPFQRPEIYWGIDANRVGIASHWRGSLSDYSAHRSHLNLLERAIQDDLESILIMEDTATFVPGANETIGQLFESMPEDWECVMLSGRPVGDIAEKQKWIRLHQSTAIRQTQCYGLRGSRAMRELYMLWADARVSGNFLLNTFLENTRTYSPLPGLTMQVMAKKWAERSDLDLLRRSLSGREPVVVLDAPRHVAEELQEIGWHRGYNRDQETGIDAGLLQLFSNSNLDTRTRLRELVSWINLIQIEVASIPAGICTIWHPEVTPDMIRHLVRGTVYDVKARSASEALSQIPTAGSPLIEELSF